MKSVPSTATSAVTTVGATASKKAPRMHHARIACRNVAHLPRDQLMPPPPEPSRCKRASTDQYAGHMAEARLCVVTLPVQWARTLHFSFRWPVADENRVGEERRSAPALYPPHRAHYSADLGCDCGRRIVIFAWQCYGMRQSTAGRNELPSWTDAGPVPRTSIERRSGAPPRAGCST